MPTPEKNDIEFSPCPHCGEVVEFVLNKTEDGSNPEIFCKGDCGMGTKMGWFGPGFADNEVMAICASLWNRRTPEKEGN